MTESILDKVREIAADIFNVPLEQLTESSSPDTIENWDSLQQLNLILALEQSFGLEFTPEEIEKMLSIKMVADLIQAKVSQNV